MGPYESRVTLAEGWQPLRVALAYRVTYGDKEFVDWVRGNVRVNGPTTLADCLQKEMIARYDPGRTGPLVERELEGGIEITHGMLISDRVSEPDKGMFYVPSKWPAPKQEVLVPNWTGRLRQLAEDFEATRISRPNGILPAKDYLKGRFEQALDEVCAWIGNGKLTARGIPVDDGVEGRAKDISRSEITQHMTLGGWDGLLYQGPEKIGPAWKSVDVWWPDLLKCHARAVEAMRPTAKAESDCCKWLKGLMAASPDRRSKPKMDLFKEACAMFPGLGKPAGIKPSRLFERAWVKAMRETNARWAMAGRTSKSPR